jgi:hypothetical protein
MICSLLEDRIKNFWGYGTWKAPIWFVGIEERFDSAKEGDDMLMQQFLYTQKYAQDGMLSVDRSHVSEWEHLANLSPFLSCARQQKTWRLPIKLYLFLKNGQPPDRHDILNFQTDILADSTHAEASTLELSPLPAPSTNEWAYGTCDLPHLQTRREYQRYLLPQRATHMHKLVKTHAPRLVIFYSANRVTHVPLWEHIAGEKLVVMSNPTRRLSMYFAKTRNTAFCVIPQPTAGVSDEELYEYATRVQANISLV